MIHKSLLAPSAIAAMLLVAVGSPTYATVVYNTDTTIDSATTIDNFRIEGGATLSVVSDLLTTSGTSRVDGSGGGTLDISGMGTVTLQNGNLNVADANVPATLIVRDSGQLNIGTGLILGSRNVATVEISDNARINIGTGPASGSELLRFGWPAALGGDPRVRLTQTGGTIDATASGIGIEFNTTYLNELLWTFSGGTILFLGDWTASGNDLLGQSFFDAADNAAATYDSASDVTTITVPEPATLALLVLGLVGVYNTRRRQIH